MYFYYHEKCLKNAKQSDPRAPALYYDARSKCIEMIFCVHAKKTYTKMKFKL